MTKQEFNDKLIGATLVIVHKTGELTKNVIADVEFTDVGQHLIHFKNCTAYRCFSTEALEFLVQRRTVGKDNERFYLETQEEKIDWEARTWQLVHDIYVFGKVNPHNAIHMALYLVDEYKKYTGQSEE